MLQEAENQYSISGWAEKTFGPPSALRTAKRAKEELEELIDALEKGALCTQMFSEVADVFIVMFQVANVLGCDAHDEINEKMQINRAREWTLNGDGTGQHVTR